ncbi:hypothetical protein [Bradyrhizobium sp. NP1]|uniref:hypothetical protein n=1 Tax=Bradyrhizobium sp. NP1 TaxID=3049772 RepID=UPI0025A57B81|nr:hypothetical protein [Bradyrhizobium sp. NP1]WJR78741.1 hypothetical protein QOU61_02710 [Bradyrhizobium sp. NP1]
MSTIAAWPFAGLAQTASKVYRIGILSTDGPVDAKSIFDAMLRALASHGYIPDRNMAPEIRASGIHSEQLPQLAKDLVASNVDVILTFSFPAAMAAKNAVRQTRWTGRKEAGMGPAEALFIAQLVVLLVGRRKRQLKTSGGLWEGQSRLKAAATTDRRRHER